METNEKISFTIANILVQIGIPYNINGSKYLKRAVELAIQNPTAVMSITKSVYKPIAKENATKSANVERAIRHAIDKASSKNKITNLNSLLGLNIYSSYDKPSNGELVALLAQQIPQLVEAYA
ncbi:MAG: sporulation initiation factor Spo0A C-terminal domain-containing protein [Clostridia bacterium]|nr:sporulation initiation factor Spo0A C-terminal domain-containing protein [Clostridia bacterium]